MYKTVKELFDNEHEHLGSIESTATAGDIFEWAFSNLSNKGVYQTLQGSLKESLIEQVSLGIKQAVRDQVDWKYPVGLLPTNFNVDLISVHESQVSQTNTDVIIEGLAVFSAKGTLENEILIGYCCFGKSAIVPIGLQLGAYPENGALDFGLGMRPDLTGRGRGYAFVNSILDFALFKFNSNLFRLTVAQFNKRAVTLYKKLGFEPVMVFPMGDVEFLTMERRNA
jgi:GNAT superfamily N-acetyltransferase